MAEVNTNTPLKALMNDPAIVADHERMIAAAPDAAPPSSFAIVTPQLEWAESKPGRWVGVSPNGAKYVVEEDKEWPIPGAYYSLTKLTAAPSGTRHLGGASDLAMVQDMALRHLTTGRV